MLTALSIRDVVLIERLDLAFGPGADRADRRNRRRQIDPARQPGPGPRRPGGNRAGARRRRAGQRRPPCFTPPDDHAVAALLDEHGLAAEDEIVLRRDRRPRTAARARSSTTIPSASACCAGSARLLVEVQGQHEQMGLADPAGHAGLLDAFGVPPPLRAGRGRGMARLARRAGDVGQAREAIAAAERDEEWLRHAVDELADPGAAARRGGGAGRANASACSRTNGAPRRSPPPWRN